jgi:hypothetical protein
MLDAPVATAKDSAAATGAAKIAVAAALAMNSGGMNFSFPIMIPFHSIPLLRSNEPSARSRSPMSWRSHVHSLWVS